MYQVYCDGYKLYDARVDECRIFNATLELELNKTGTFSFEIYPDHPNFNCLQTIKSEIIVWQDSLLIFRGRILNVEQGFYNQKQVTCEGELAFLLDSIMRPYGTEASPWSGTIEEYLNLLIDNHNEQMRLVDDETKTFRVGRVTVTAGDENIIERFDTDFRNTWELVTENLTDSLGGYLWVRHEVEDGKLVTYIDYLAADDLPQYSTQAVEFGVNLLDLKKAIRGEDLMTAIIPLGEGDSPVTINGAKDANGNVVCTTDYLIDEEAANLLGVIFKTVQFDTSDSYELWKQAKAYLESAVKFPTSIELTAADRAGISDEDAFHLGQKIIIKDKYHGLDEVQDSTTDEYEFITQKLAINLLQPANSRLTVGATFLTFTERANKTASAQNKIGAQVSSSVQSVKTELTGQLQNYYLKDEANNTLAGKGEVEESINNAKTEISSQMQSLIDEINKLKARVDELNPSEDSGEEGGSTAE